MSLTMDDVYELKESLRNLIMLKIAYDYELDMSKFHDFYVNYDMGINDSFDIFMSAIIQQFEVFDYIGGDDDESMEAKRYWACDTDVYESTAIIVLLDDRKQELFSNFTFADIPTYSREPYRYEGYGGYCDIFDTEKGIVILYDEEDGPVDWLEIFSLVIEYGAHLNNVESESNEMSN
ncbi:hypothetical protein [Bacillus cihuensis]|uniref:hypothetical protein n=1 Tax=Bacillus cihuensis TaxID=1208599 RepID=UPI0003FE5F71|nr:hypothetical protein [Bacillus cihuensis]